MLNPIFWKKVLGHKHPGRWGIVEHQIPSIKVLFKTNTKCHKHPGIKLLSESKTQLVNQRKQDSYRRAHTHTPIYIHTYIYIYILTQSFWTGTKVIRRKHIIQPSNPQVSAPVSRPVVNGIERMCQRHGNDQTPTLLFESKNHVSINSYSLTLCSRGVFAVNNSKLRDCVIVAIDCFFCNNWQMQYNGRNV